MSQPLKIFISYARKDASFKDDFLLHLKPLVRNGVVQPWHDDDVMASEEWEGKIHESMEKADVLIFLVSPAFMASDYINDVEIKKAIERYQQQKVAIVPIWTKPIAVSDPFLDKFQSLPKDRKPVSQWSDADEAWVDVVQRLRKLFENMQGKTPAPPSPAADNKQQNSKAPSIDKSHIRDLISRSKTKDALKLLLEHTNNEDGDSHNSLTLLAARFAEMERNGMLGVTTHAEQQMERNRINLALLSLLDDIE